MSHPSVRDGLSVIRSATMCSNGLDDAPGLSPRWVCDLPLMLILLCGTLCVCLCSIPNFPMCTRSLCPPNTFSFFLANLLPLDPFPLHFHIYFLIADPLFQCALLPLFVFISHTLVCAFMLLHLCLCTCTQCFFSHLLHFSPPACPPVRAVGGEGQAEGGFSFEKQNCWECAS